MPVLYTAKELEVASMGRVQNLPENGVSSISIDSREISKGALFVAIQGERFDAHDFVNFAFDEGAAVAMVSAERAAQFGNEPLVIVDDPMDGLRRLAVHSRTRSDARIVAVTGSVGKTTTKEAIALALRGAGQVHASVKSFNNHWGVPLTLARMSEATAFGIFEIGMNHAGEISPLTEMVRPHVAVITSIAAAHLAAFESVADIARAKAEIFQGVTPGGSAVVNADHPYLEILLREAESCGVRNVITYGFARHASVRADNCRLENGYMLADVFMNGKKYTLRIKALGQHMVSNALAALVVADQLGVDVEPALANLACLSAPTGRGAVLKVGTPTAPITLIDESYNANPASMQSALETFGMRNGAGRKIIVLGDMLELGEHTQQMHANLAADINRAKIDKIYLVGRNMAALRDVLGTDRVAGYALSSSEITGDVINSLAMGDQLMVKGSNSVGLSGLVKEIRDAFGDVKETTMAGKGSF